MHVGYQRLAQQSLYQWKTAYNGWNDPEVVTRASKDPFVGGIFATRYNQKVDEENKRSWNDRFRYTGETWRKSPYPFTAYRNTVGSTSFGPGDYFEASEAIINQNLARLRRWY